MKFEVGDLVTLSKAFGSSNKHTAGQCKLGIVLSQEQFDDETLYKVHWWPFDQAFYFLDSDLRLVSRIFLQKTDDFGIILNDIEDFEEE
tara:strand:- start:161 stop:427 length:267 start_codon:yes stop_codon:yes gene_type:complete